MLKNKKLHQFFFVLSIIGLISGLIVHLISIMGKYLGNDYPFVWALHFGVFVVFIPAILSLRNNAKLTSLESKKPYNPVKKFTEYFQYAPKSIKVLIMLFFVYAIINFYLVFAVFGSDGQELSDSQQLRAFSGHWMLFYAVSMGILWPPNLIQVKNDTSI